MPYHYYVSDRMHALIGCPAMNARRDKWDRWFIQQRVAGMSDDLIFQKLRSAITTATKEFSAKHKLTGLNEALFEAIDLAQQSR